jgi:hypothetical protein
MKDLGRSERQGILDQLKDYEMLSNVTYSDFIIRND